MCVNHISSQSISSIHVRGPFSLYICLTPSSGSERETEIYVMQCVFTGPPRVGKSSFWKRLQGIIPDRILPSTDITGLEGSTRFDIRGSCGFSVHVSVQGWRKVQAEEEMEGFISLVTQQGNPFLQEPIQKPGEGWNQASVNELTQGHPESVGRKQDDDTPQQDMTRLEDLSYTEEDNGSGAHAIQKDVALPVDNKSVSEQDMVEEGKVSEQHLPSPSAVLNQALINMRQAQISNRMDSASYVICTDTGGQPEYQELLSLLIAACNAVFIIFNLEHDLHSIQPLEYLPSVNDDPVIYDSPCTIGEMLYQSLVSVPIHSSSQTQTSMEVFQNQPDIQSARETFVNHSCVFFVGTHKDKVDSLKIRAINRDLIELIQHTPQYKANIVQQSSGDSYIFAVDNFSSLQKDEDFVTIRRTTQGLVYGSQVKVKAPTTWLFTGIILQNLSETQPIVTFDRCQEIAQQCGIEQDSFRHCLEFLHRTIGAIRYYDTEHLQNIVILKPQVVINVLSHFMRRAFLKPITLKAVVVDDDISDTASHFKLITRDLLIDIALDLLLMCPHPSSTAEQSMYYLTCMLPMIKEDNLSEDERASVYFTLEGHVLPIGLGRATITAIVQQQVHAKPPWIINYDKLFRNCLEFSLSSPPICFQIKCSTKHLCLKILKSASAVSVPYTDVRVQIESIITEVLKLYQYGCAKSPIVAFSCPHCDFGTDTPHYAILLAEDVIECTHTKKCAVVPSELKHWVMVSFDILHFTEKITVVTIENVLYLLSGRKQCPFQSCKSRRY